MSRKQLEQLIFWVAIAVFGTLILMKAYGMLAGSKKDMAEYKEKSSVAEKMLDQMGKR